jgi:hypothetical protein
MPSDGASKFPPTTNLREYRPFPKAFGRADQLFWRALVFTQVFVKTIAYISNAAADGWIVELSTPVFAGLDISTLIRPRQSGFVPNLPFGEICFGRKSTP